jgi:hypothetical protein
MLVPPWPQEWQCNCSSERPQNHDLLGALELIDMRTSIPSNTTIDGTVQGSRMSGTQ